MDFMSNWILTALISGLLGALLAMFSRMYVDRLARRREEENNLKKAQLVLGHYINYMRRLEHTLDPFRTADVRHRKVVKHLMPSAPFEMNYGDLAFLVNYDQAQVMMHVSLAVDNYLTVRSLVQEHGEAYDDLIDNAQIEGIDSQTGIATIQLEVGKDRRLKVLVDALYRFLPEAISSVDKANTELFAVGKKIFKRGRFVKFGAFKP